MARDTSLDILATQADRSLRQAFSDCTNLHPEARLVVAKADGTRICSLNDIYNAGLKVSRGLSALKVGPGDIIAVQLPAWKEWMIACIAAAELGAILLPIVSIYGGKELSFILNQSKAKVLITPHRWHKTDYEDLLRDCGPLPNLTAHLQVGPGTEPGSTWNKFLCEETPPPQSAGTSSPDDAAMLVYTSGTTSEPKGVLHSSRSLLAEIASMSAMRDYLAKEVVLSPWPPGHIAGAVFMMRYLVDGIPLVTMDQWNPARAARLIETYRINSAAFTPYHLSGLLDASTEGGFDISSLSDCVVGASPVSPSLIQRCSDKGIRTYRAYGSTEHPTSSSGAASDPEPFRLQTEGKPAHGSEFRFVDDYGHDVAPGTDGEIVVRGPEQFLGYLDEKLNKFSFLPGRWFKTGDIGRLNEDGYLIVTDRKKDIIIRGGENISSREVEEILLTHPHIVEAAAIGVPDERMGEVVCACLVLQPGVSIELCDIVNLFANACIAKQKTPEKLQVLGELPRNATGKINKPALRRMVATTAPHMSIKPQENSPRN